MYPQMHQTAMTQGLPSKRPYKKLGTILEHIAESINPFFYQFSIVIVSHYPLAVNIRIETIPTMNVPQPMTMCVIPWIDKSNGHIHINPSVLHDAAEW